MDTSEAHPRGLVLDDYLHEAAQALFDLPAPSFGLQEIQSYPGARDGMEKIVKGTISLYRAEIFAPRHPLLRALGEDIYSDADNGLRWRISGQFVTQVVKRTIEIGLQAIVHLPRRDPKRTYSSKRIVSLGNQVRALAQKIETELRQEEVRQRTRICFEESDEKPDRLYRLPAEMQWAAEKLVDLAGLKLKKIWQDTRSPQVRFGMYFVAWIEACTGGKHYEDLTTLMHAAFTAGGKNAPPWVNRLAIEMHTKGRIRRNFSKQVLLVKDRPTS